LDDKIKDEVDVTYRSHGSDYTCVQNFILIISGRRNLGDLDADGEIILKLISKK
jgi:hypothetical protein